MNDFELKVLFYRNKYFFNRLSELFYKARICRFSIIKGDPLSVWAFGYPGGRIYSDIDCLISPKSVSIFHKILTDFGFTYQDNRISKIFCLHYSHQLLPYYNSKFDISIDLNFDIFWGEYEGKRVDIEEFLSDTVEMEIYGVKVKTLPPLKTMVQLVLHHYKDMNSIFLLATRNSIRYEMFKDVYYLLKNNLEEISIEKLYKISSEYEIIPYVFYVLYYTGQVFDDEILKEYIEAFRTPEGERLLNLYGLCEKERKEWRVDFKTRLETENLLPLIEVDLTDRDRRKIEINKKIFMGADNEKA